MKWNNPIINAVAASAYIAALSLFIHYVSSLRHDTPDTLLDGMGFLSLFVFSAAVMAFLFFYKPTLLLIENKKAEAISYFLKTLAAFGVITGVLLVLVSAQ